MTPAEVLSLIHEYASEHVDLRYTDLRGRLRHVTVPAARLEPAGAGFAPLPHADAALAADAATAFADPFCQHPTVALLAERVTAGGEPLELEPRAVARRAAAALAAGGRGMTVEVGLELAFFVFEQAYFDQSVAAGRYGVDSREGVWRRGRDEADNLGLALDPARADEALPPSDTLHNLRAEMVAALTACGVAWEEHRRGPATGGQAVIRLAPRPLVAAADAVQVLKYVVRNVAARHGKVATFMPQPLGDGPGSGVRATLRLTQAGRSVSVETAAAAAAGLKRHAAGLAALARPTTNSYRRGSVSGDDAARGAGETEVVASAGADGPVVRYDGLDGGANPYLALAGVAAALCDGLTEGGAAAGRVAAAAERAGRPGDLAAARAALARDTEFLTRGGVFAAALLAAWDEVLGADLAAMGRRPHPYEFCLYFDL